ncbi:MAG: 16S rRNA (cytosine(967)-C(5))-methyltransferase RsmB [Lachnospiraceae bacterium]|nr:16S rRNA (cytosine(967)-C(5))-methyltransferase RsmB [Lachnospiraceae bacterium]
MADVNVRSLAVDIVTDVCEEGVFLHIELRRALNKYAYLERSEKAFMVRLSSGTIERLVTIDAVVNHFSKLKISKMKPFIRNLLRISVYQIMYMDAVPDSAVCNEAVKLVRKRHYDNLSGFVNGVLRSIARDYKEVKLTDAQRFSVSDELYELFKTQYPENYAQILESFLSNDHSTILRFNKSLIDASRIKSIAEKYGMKTISEEMAIYSVSGSEGIEDIEGFDEGLFAIQDTSAALPVYLSGAKSGDICLDLCAAPGGKTVQLLDMLGGEGEVVSRDISEAKLPMIEENVLRCGFDNVRIEYADASEYLSADDKKYDIVLADVPCSGLGIIANKPDIKQNFKREACDELAELSRRIVYNAGRYVKENGLLVFSTCTLNRGENSEICKFIREKFDCESVKLSIPSCMDRYEYTDDELTIFPTPGVCEGFFVAMFRIRGVRS